MKNCIQCSKSVKDLTFECPFCGGRKFQQEEDLPKEIIKPIESQTINLEAGLYSQKLDGLIDLALSDGELTEKEKQVLFKKAEAEGIDLDEFEMVLDAKLKQLQISNTQKTSNHLYTQQSAPPPPLPINLSAPAITSREAYIQLEYLIDMGLKDGLISDLEKHTIIEKGISLGISRNEIEMILTNKIEEKAKFNAQSAAPKSDKYGDVKKCPSCGAIAQSFQTKCPDCSHEFINIEANVSINKLFKMLNDAENMRIDDSESSNPLKAIGSFYAKSFSAMTGPGNIEKKKMEIISNFPIPTTKNDILEFLALAVPKAKQKGNFLTKNNPEYKTHNEFVTVWNTKCEQIIMKAKFSMKEDKKALEEIMQYANELGIK
jgi:hypothetical protein